MLVVAECHSIIDDFLRAHLSAEDLWATGQQAVPTHAAYYKKCDGKQHPAEQSCKAMHVFAAAAKRECVEAVPAGLASIPGRLSTLGEGLRTPNCTFRPTENRMTVGPEPQECPGRVKACRG